ncbi:flagellar assembly protein FliW [Bacillus sp. RG28]|uniref:Flagellar assembly factor FliW n=1 Tax=Gottfriedia endophytica TaxID=2820819 RepID=A0A940NQ37_9BACI|nr:flagellar assembly protein FliW [Gottfriedia endophytica]MBP0726741.1 flagellar assembly protein FliW [Gottfriedia endophytica]
MKIQTKYHGEVVIQQEDLLTFPKGIPAFEDENEFTILPFQEGIPFSILQSTKTPNLAFVIGEVFLLFPTYEIELPQNAIDELQLQEAKDAIVYCIITIKENFYQSTANLQAPLIINSVKKIGKQVVLNHPTYKTKHDINSSPAFSVEG